MELSEEQIRQAHKHITDDQNLTARLETYQKRIEPTYSKLVEVAEDESIIEYAELAEFAETNEREYMGKLLLGISFIEHKEGRPPLTVLVVQAGTKDPSNGFDNVIEEFELRNRYPGLSREEMLREMRKDVYREWGSN